MIAHIVLNVQNFSRSEAFYDRLLPDLGYSGNYCEEGDGYSAKCYRQEASPSPDLLIKCEASAEHKVFVREIGLDHLAFKAESRDAVDLIFKKLSLAGVTITRPPAQYPEYSADYYAFYFRDPDGIPLEVAYC